MTWSPDEDLKAKAKELSIEMMKEALDQYVDARQRRHADSIESNTLRDLFAGIAAISMIKDAFEKEVATHPANIPLLLIVKQSHTTLEIYVEFALNVVYAALRDGASEQMIRDGIKDEETRNYWTNKLREKRAAQKDRPQPSWEHIARALGLNPNKVKEDDEIH